ncbi:MAG: hypothetical protein ACXAAQ_11110, partial [Candidatus Thorarchaeota archaeon]
MKIENKDVEEVEQRDIDTEVESDFIPEEMEESFAPVDIIVRVLMGILGFFIGIGKRLVSFFKWIGSGFHRIYRFFLDPGQSIRQFMKR